MGERISIAIAVMMCDGQDEGNGNRKEVSLAGTGRPHGPLQMKIDYEPKEDWN